MEVALDAYREHGYSTEISYAIRHGKSIARLALPFLIL
jgi:hypothetical protein